jgi:hypothetical protein
MVNQNPYSAPQTVRSTASLDSTPSLIDDAMLPVIRGAAVCYRALTILVRSIVACGILWLFFMGGTERLFLLLLAAGVVISAIVHLWGLARMRSAPVDSGVGWLLTLSLCLGLLYFMIQFVVNPVIYLYDWTQHLSVTVWGATLSSFGSNLLLLLGIQKLGSFAKKPKILLPCRLALLCLLISYGVAIAFEMILTYPEQTKRLGIFGYFERISFASIGAIAIVLLAMMMGLAFYAMALNRLMSLNEVIQAMQLETPPHLEVDGSLPQRSNSTAHKQKYDFLNADTAGD